MRVGGRTGTVGPGLPPYCKDDERSGTANTAAAGAVSVKKKTEGRPREQPQ